MATRCVVYSSRNIYVSRLFVLLVFLGPFFLMHVQANAYRVVKARVTITCFKIPNTQLADPISNECWSTPFLKPSSLSQVNLSISDIQSFRNNAVSGYELPCLRVSISVKLRSIT
ncbi:hypothetical protein BDB00DRAFT_809025 [Zychaea mexicana]|uniref:uncharacterized protein n=1 Tax=Zychaea mexicana TaxID=64656 RepID=UPI0022FEC35E|nr:uncharacterized protein BDB00DRAFT_809025 [Zychaea mexicana]KAI9496477.1 hypothetical protein BDB00DRAFT_809025 [Zychaea mexicana]